MAETAGRGPSCNGMFTCSEVGDYRIAVAGHTEIAAAITCIIVEGGFADRAAGELAGMTAGIGSDMTLGATNVF